MATSSNPTHVPTTQTGEASQVRLSIWETVHGASATKASSALIWHGQWKRFRAERDEEVLSALNVLVVGAYVFQTNFARISFLSSVMLNGKG